MPARSTKEKILDAAEKLFAEHGFGATSMRSLTSAAGVNLAAVNYHFGTKEALIEAVLARRLAPLNRRRLEMLAEVEREAGNAPPPLARVVEAFVGPALRMAEDTEGGGPEFMRLFGHMMTQPRNRVREIFTEQFREVVERFTPAIQRCLPQLDDTELLWRFFFMVGAMAHTMALRDDLQRFVKPPCAPPDAEQTLGRLVPFLTAGLSAPLPGEPECP